MTALAASNYALLQIKKYRNNEPIKVDIQGKTPSIDYYESLYSPHLTMNIIHFDTGGSVISEKTGLTGTLKDALPLQGNEQLSLLIRNESGDLQFGGTGNSSDSSSAFNNRPFVVKTSRSNVDESNRQLTAIELLSWYGMKNIEASVSQKYPTAKISNIVEKILLDYGVPRDRLFIDPTSNEDMIDGNFKNPFELIVDVAKKSVPEGVGMREPGYFFYETQDGLHFKSIDNLISEGKEKLSDKNSIYAKTHSFSYFTQSKSNLDNDQNDYRILNPPSVISDWDVAKNRKFGVDNVRLITYNTENQDYNESYLNLMSTTTLGNIPDDVEFSFPTEGIFNNTESAFDFPSKTFTYMLGSSNEVSVQPFIRNPAPLWEPRAWRRYALLHAQLVKILVPCNVNLKVGDVIYMDLENITTGEKIIHMQNPTRSGTYLIMHLCHHFDPNNSYTSLVVARDGYDIR